MKYYPTYNSKLKSNSRTLRKCMTPAEKKLWSRLRRKYLYGTQFFRQKPLGNYIVDFYCPAKKLVIEVDGGHHCYDDKQVANDKKRDAYLKKVCKLKILRFNNVDILNSIDEVLGRIAEEVDL